MIGDHLSSKTHQRLKFLGSVAVIGFYLTCVVQARQWSAYSSICGPLTLLLWVWGLSAYKRPRERGKIANFGTQIGIPLGRITEIAGVPTGFQRSQLLNMDGLLVRPDPGEVAPGGKDIPFCVSKTTMISKVPTPPIVRFSRYKKVSDSNLWVL